MGVDFYSKIIRLLISGCIGNFTIRSRRQTQRRPRLFNARPLPCRHGAGRFMEARKVLQTSQKWPEIAGSKRRGFAKPSERFQRFSPKSDRLPLHHSTIPHKPLVLQNFLSIFASGFANGPGHITGPVVSLQPLSNRPSKQPASTGFRRLCCVILGQVIVLSIS